MKSFNNIAINAIPFISKEWKEVYGAFLQEEHLLFLSNRLSHYDETGFYIKPVAPFFVDEVTVDSQYFFVSLKRAMQVIKEHNYESNDLTNTTFAEALEQTPFNEVLLLLGQRLTSASITNQKAIPPLKEDVLIASLALHNKQISKATRAWEKHAQRSEESFWGTVKGNPTEKEQKVTALVAYILNHKTWWNIFYHYKHEIVYEVRISSGHGIRWKKESLELIGFLEPFEN